MAAADKKDILPADGSSTVVSTSKDSVEAPAMEQCGSEPSRSLPKMTRDEVAEEVASGGRKLIIINKLVIDIGEYARKHPGGEVIEDYLGADATSDFESIGHSQRARTKLAQLVVGEINT